MILHPIPESPSPPPLSSPLGQPEPPAGAGVGLGTGAVLGLIFAGLWLVASDALTKAGR